MQHANLVFLKLGGSLITDKEIPLTTRPEIIQSIAAEIAQALEENPQIQLIIGHGSGSFGHAVAHQYQTQTGGQTADYWLGFQKVWAAAHQLNQIVIDHLLKAGLPVMAFPPSASVVTENRMSILWEIQPLKTALSHHLIPVVQGDVVFDTALGGTIISTEQVFQFLAEQLHPHRILIAGIEPGVYRDPENPGEIIPLITPQNIDQALPLLGGSHTRDVTGGMLAKVQTMLSLVGSVPSLQIFIYSGLDKGNILKALQGYPLGTLIKA